MARNPHAQGGLATPPPQLDDESDAPGDPQPDDGDPGPAPDDSGDDTPTRDRPRDSGFRGGRAVSVANDGAGWVLGVILWGWVVLPFVKGGPAGVKKVLMAKFLNKAPDGSWLP